MLKKDMAILEGSQDMNKFIKGVDLSTLVELEKCGAKYYDNGKEEGVLSILKRYDFDTVRIRVWNDPYAEDKTPYGAGTNDTKTSIEIGKQVTKAGYGVLLNLHYSDFWADPGKQFKPKAWKDYGIEELEKAEQALAVEELIAEAIEGVRVERF